MKILSSLQSTSSIDLFTEQGRKMNCYTTDLWQIGIVQAPIQHIVASGSLDGFRIKWITPDKSLTFLADPFGLWKKGFSIFSRNPTIIGLVVAILSLISSMLTRTSLSNELCYKNHGIFLILLCLKPITKSGCYLKDINQVR